MLCADTVLEKDKVRPLAIVEDDAIAAVRSDGPTVKMAQVYAICFPNGKLYVGWTSKTVEQRFREHQSKARNGSTYTVHKALRKYGPDSVRLVTLHSGVTDDEAQELEKWHIAEWDLLNTDNGYNMTAGGEGMADPAPEVRAKMGKAQKRRWQDPEFRQKKLEALHSPEHCRKLAETSRRLWQDPEYRAKTLEAVRASAVKAGKASAEACRGKSFSLERCRKMSEAQKRRWQDPEFRQKMSEVLHSPEHCRKLSEARRGKPLSPEHCRKLSEAQRRRRERERQRLHDERADLLLQGHSAASGS